jgi:hypothetical protein
MKVQTNVKAGIGDVKFGDLSNSVTVTTATVNSVILTDNTSTSTKP